MKRIFLILMMFLGINFSLKSESIKNSQSLSKDEIIIGFEDLHAWVWDMPWETRDGGYKAIIRGFKVDDANLAGFEADRMEAVIENIWNRMFESAELEIVGYTDSEEDESLALKRAKKFSKLFREKGLKKV